MRYKMFGATTGLRVSEISLGCGMFGTTWGHGAEPAEARRMFETYVEAGGNFFDTADTYQVGESERILGELIAPNRDDYVIATKYTMGDRRGGSMSMTGNSRKNLVRSVEKSLARLKTDYIDVYWVHHPDEVTSIDEIMRGFDDLVKAGKILYGGLSNFPAWRVATAATLAELRGWAPLAGIQIEYSLVERTPDRELLPVRDAFGLGAVAWSPLGGGLLTGKYRRGEVGRASTWKNLIHHEDSNERRAILDTLEAIAKETESNAGQVAIAWVSARGLVPIVGPRTKEQLEDNLASTRLRLTESQIRRLDDVSAVRLGFPHEMTQRFKEVPIGLAGGHPELVDRHVTPIR